ncbi:hypothetical protein TNCV_485561 [Trichonephila clavipes]|nr:hypothetical protein TNCV_485561 [Trichonephila clavipes]
MVGRHILEDIVGRVAQYGTSIIPVDKWHLGRLDSMGSTIGVKISSTYLRAVKVPEGPLKMIVCPKKLLHTVTPCEIAVCRSTINAGSTAGRCASQTRAVVISTETESGDSSLKITRLQSVTLQSCPRSAKIQSTLPMMWGQW